MEKQPHWEKLLSDRGLLAEAKRLDWTPDGSGWRYPLYNIYSQQPIEGVSRWKNFNSGGSPKYKWEPTGATNRPTYYTPPGTLEAIESSMGRVIIASGEPDVLAFRSAGVKNVISWFGEGNTPDTLASDLYDIGVSAVEIYPDLDETGSKWALQIADALQKSASGIYLYAYVLPGTPGSKMDVNRLWIDCAFVADRFWDALACAESFGLYTLPQLVYDTPALPPTMPSKADDFPEGYYEAIERALGVVGYKSDGWSRPIKCPLKEHEHDKPGNYAAAWHRDKKIYSCLKCGVTDMLSKDIASALGIDWREYKPLRSEAATSRQGAPTRQQTGASQPSAAKTIYSFQEAAQTVLNEIDGTLTESIHEPLPIPFRAIRAFGGLAKVIPPGKIMAVVADSGMGKTSFMETLWDHWLRSGFNGVVWGPEWTKEEYVYRAIQRHGGPSVMQTIDHRAWHAARTRGLPEDKRPGQALDRSQSDKAKAVLAMIGAWPGKLMFVERMSVSATELIEKLNEVVAGFAANERRISFAVCDYAQLLRAPGEKANDRIDKALSDFKAFCVDKQLVGVVASQIQKEAGRAQANGGASTLHDMQNARSDYFNLALTITREFEAGEQTPKAKVRVTKNSLGRKGDAYLFVHGEKMLWTDLETIHVTPGLDLKPITVTDKERFGERDHDDD